MDVLSPEQRHKAMAAIKSKNTKPELQIRKLLFSLGYRFRLQRKDLPGRPDIVLPKYKTVIFVNGCFWHAHPGCKHAHLPETNTGFWRDKLARNSARDARNTALLRALGWNVVVIWQCQIKDVLQSRHIPGLPPRQTTPAFPDSIPLPYPENDSPGTLLAAEGEWE